MPHPGNRGTGWIVKPSEIHKLGYKQQWCYLCSEKHDYHEPTEDQIKTYRETVRSSFNVMKPRPKRIYPG